MACEKNSKTVPVFDRKGFVVLDSSIQIKWFSLIWGFILLLALGSLEDSVGLYLSYFKFNLVQVTIENEKSRKRLLKIL